MKLIRLALVTVVVLAVGCLLVVDLVGIRYPPPQLIPPTAPLQSDEQQDVVVRASGAIFQQRDGDRFIFRAFVPEPQISVTNDSGGAWRVEVSNIHPGASLVDNGHQVAEQTDNLLRAVSGSSPKAEFKWRFHSPERYRFAAIGDTGGGSELNWVLQRAYDLGADFVLHLGDFYYEPGEYLSTVAALSEARIPTYVAIGNHDFYEGLSSVHQYFSQYIGPRNVAFRLGGVQFVSVDTAAIFIPADGGARGEFLRTLIPAEDVDDIVLFTHKPLADPREGESHSVFSWEYEYLHAELRRLGVDTILVGHIHIKEDFNDNGIRTIVSGEGLAHADLIVGSPVSHILMGEVSAGLKEVVYRWLPMDMPFEAHCNPRAWQVLELMKNFETLEQLRNICSGTDAPS